MYSTIKSVLETGRFELSNILSKIDTFWVRGSLTDKEYTELSLLAQNNAKPENSIDFLKKFEEFEQRLKAIEEKDTYNDVTATDEYPDFQEGKWYYAGNKMTFEGDKYECIAPNGVVCVWSPKDYPAYWKLIL